MVNVLIVLVIVGSSLWVYHDATSNKIGKQPSGAGLFNMSAGAWAVVTLLLWIVAFPAYLIKRNALVEKAKEQPVEASGRGIKLVVIAAIGGLWVFGTIAANNPHTWAAIGGSSPILAEVSGVWRAESDGSMITLDLANENKSLSLGSQPIPVTIDSVDTANDIVNLEIAAPDQEPLIWTVRQLWDEKGETFYITLTLHDGTQDTLSYVRDL